MQSRLVGVLLPATLAITAPAAAQVFPFERSYDVGQAPVIDVSTARGKINIRTGEPGRVVVTGATRVRVGLTVPVNALDLARQVAEMPPIERSGDRLRLCSPSDRVVHWCRSGECRHAVERDGVAGVSGALTTTTESGRTTISGLPSAAWDVSAGSGSIQVEFEGAVNATLRASTGSGSVEAPARMVQGSIEKRRVEGAIGAGGPVVRLASRSGSIRVR